MGLTILEVLIRVTYTFLLPPISNPNFVEKKAMSIGALKRSLRIEMRSILSHLSDEIIQTESAKVTGKLLQTKEYQTSQNISIYINMAGEIITRDVIKDIFLKGKSCYVPRWGKDTMEMVKLTSWEDYLSLPLNKLNIPEPLHDQDREIALEGTNGLDLIVMPGVAFDAERNRLGHGKGYYDRYLKKTRKWAESVARLQPRTVALALEAQIIANGRIPFDEMDVLPDMILTANMTLSS